MDNSLRDKLMAEGKCVACTKKPALSGRMFCRDCEYRVVSADHNALRDTYNELRPGKRRKES